MDTPLTSRLSSQSDPSFHVTTGRERDLAPHPVFCQCIRCIGRSSRAISTDTSLTSGDVQSDVVSTADIACARTSLTTWVDRHAVAIACDVGFGWIIRPDAPSTYPELCAAYARSVRTGAPLPVSSENSASVILTSPEANFAWRFVHDMAHVERKLSFSLPDEYELALWHLSELERAGFTPDSLEYAFLKADTLGQVLINAVARRFPADQELFDLECQRYGFEVGVLREIRREQP